MHRLSRIILFNLTKNGVYIGLHLFVFLFEAKIVLYKLKKKLMIFRFSIILLLFLRVIRAIKVYWLPKGCTKLHQAEGRVL